MHVHKHKQIKTMHLYFMAFSFLQTISSIYILLAFTCTTSLISHDQECLALFEFKETFLHHDYPYFDARDHQFHKLESWRMITSNNTSDNPLSGSDCCLWDGVVCNNKSQLTGLDLGGSALTGVINSSTTLFKLVHLQMLNLSMNNFVETQIPSEIAALKQLRSLNLSNSGFKGKIPNEISQLIHLSSLDLSLNPLKLQSQGLEYLLQNMTRLETLRLSGLDLSSSVPAFLANFSSLRSIKLYDCQLQDEFPSAIFHLPNLKTLIIGRNSNLTGLLPEFHNRTLLEYLSLFSTGFTGTIPKSIGNINNLKWLDLFDCYFTGSTPPAIFHLPKLQFLDISLNSNLTGSLPKFYNNNLLKYLILFSTGFTGIIPKSMGNLNHLEVLDLKSCSFSGSIPDSLSNLTQLRYLSLSANEFTGLVPSLASLSELAFLNLSYNSFEIGCAYDWIKKVTKLEELYLDCMNIHDEVLPYLANLTELRVVSMAGNFISGHIPSSFMNLTQLLALYLQTNQFQGSISNSFLNFKSLEYLDIASNNFSGTVNLDSFLGLKKLRSLDLGSNSLSFVTTTNYTNATLPKLKFLGLASCHLKEFPAFLRFQMEMKSLILFENEIEGLIPNWIWNNSRETLQMIDLNNNFISGFHQHPNFFSSIQLEAIYLSNNQLNGRLPIPPQTTIVYDVSHNNLSGEIPSMICEIKCFQLLDLSSNQMIGTLPSCLSNLNKLLVLDLKQNNFHGPMNYICMHGSLLKMIDLSENQFVGRVSKSFTNCTYLKFLSLGDNFIRDVFPLWLGTLPELQVLFLRSNKFYGAIQGLSTHSSKFLKLRILDISNNDFSGQLPHESFQTWNAMKSVYVGKSSALESRITLGSSFRPYDSTHSMMLTVKGVQEEYMKILNLFMAMDLSSNHFEGHIPRSLQDLHGLKSLNLSNNHFTGHILPSLGNLTNLESLDLSQNKLSGQIPQEFLQLNFLGFFNVSFNHLDGPIPEGRQFNTFENNSYFGNPRLCGKPLLKECGNSMLPTILSPRSNNDYEFLLPSDRIDWMVISLGLGSGLIIGLLIGNFLYTRYMG